MSANQVECRRCGWKWVVAADKRGETNLLCKSCRQKPVKIIQYGDLRCEPHQGEVDQDLNPITETGELYLPGERICGNKDCVNKSHIVASAE